MSLVSISKSLAATLLCTLVAATAFADSEIVLFDQKTFRGVEVSCEDGKIKQTATDFIRSRVPHPIRYEDLRKTLDVLYGIGNLRSIDVRERGELLHVTLIPTVFIDSVIVTGNRFLKRDQILTALNLNFDDLKVFDSAMVYQNKLLNLYERSGFSDTKVSIKLQTRKVRKREMRDLLVDIDEGSPIRSGEINIDGDVAPFSEERVRSIIGIRVGERLDSERLKNRLEKLRKSYVSRGYLTASIQIDDLMRDYGDRLARLNIRVEKGPHTKVQFRGRRYFFQDRNSILQRVIGLADEQTLSKGFLEEATDNLREFYLERGYADAVVTYTDKTSSDGQTRTIVFLIDKGRRVRIRSIRFRENTEVSSSTIRSFISDIDIGDPYYQPGFAENMKTIQQQLQNRGFHNAALPTVTEEYSADRKFVDLIINTYEGPIYNFGITQLDFDPSDDKELVAKVTSQANFKRGSPFVLTEYQKRIREITATCKDYGYYFCKVEPIPSLSSTNEDEVDLRIEVATGPKVYVGDIFLQGNRVTEDHVITRELLFKSGDLYTPKKIENSQRAIQRLGFFLSVQIDQLDYQPKTNRAELIVRIRERKRRNVRVRMGVGSDEGARLRTDLNYLNLWGTGRNLYLSGGVSHEFFGDILELRGSATYLEPRLFNLPVDGRMQFQFQREQEEFGNIERTSFILGVDQKYKEWFQNLLRWELEFRDPFDLRIPAEDLNDFDEARRLFGSIGTVLTLDFRDSKLNPTWGYLANITAEYYSEAFLSEEEFYQVFSRNSFYLPIYKEVNFVVSVRAGFSGTLGSTSAAGSRLIPVEKRFRLGGSQTLRGFSRDSVGGQDDDEPALGSDPPAPGGNSVFNYLAEIGFPIGGGFRLVGFTDGGNAFLTNTDIDLTNLRYSAGVGLRYVTPVGPLRLDFGFKLDRRTGESLGELHFAVGLF